MRRDNKAFKERFARWKNGEQVYDKGRPIPAYRGGKSAHDAFVELMGPVLYQELLKTKTPNINVAYDNMLRQLAYESNYGRSNIAQKQHNYGGYGWNGKTYTTFKDDADFIAHYVKLMNNRYADAVNASSIQDYAKALKENGYYEDTQEHYASLLNGMKSLSKAASKHRLIYPDLYEDPTSFVRLGEAKKPMSLAQQIDATRVNKVVPESEIRYTWDGAEDVSPYLTGRPIPNLNRPKINIPTVTEVAEQNRFEPAFKYGKKSQKIIIKRGNSQTQDSALLHALNDNSYDYRGFYNKYPNDLSNANTHWTDEFKTVYHPTFSKESIYSGNKSQYNPEGIEGGDWYGEHFVPNWKLMRPPKYKYGKTGLPKYEIGKDEEEFYQRMQERQRAINESQPKPFVDATLDFKYNVDPVQAVYSDPLTGEVWQSGMPKGTVILPNVTVKGSRLNAEEAVRNLPVEKGLETPMLDPLVLALGGGKYSGDLIGDLIGELIGKGIGKLSTPVLDYATRKVLRPIKKFINRVDTYAPYSTNPYAKEVTQLMPNGEKISYISEMQVPLDVSDKIAQDVATTWYTPSVQDRKLFTDSYNNILYTNPNIAHTNPVAVDVASDVQFGLPNSSYADLKSKFLSLKEDFPELKLKLTEPWDEIEQTFGFEKTNRLFDLFKKHPEYAQFLKESAEDLDPFAQETIDKFLTRQFRSIRGVHAPNKEEAVPFLTTTEKGRHMSGGDRFNTEGGLYTSNAPTVADRFKNPEQGVENGYVGILDYPHNIPKDIPIEDLLEMYRQMVYPANGINPIYGTNHWFEELNRIKADPKIIALEGDYVGRANKGMPGQERAYLPKDDGVQLVVNIHDLQEYINQVNKQGRWGIGVNGAGDASDLFIPRQLNAYSDYIRIAKSFLKPKKAINLDVYDDVYKETFLRFKNRFELRLRLYEKLNNFLKRVNKTLLTTTVGLAIVTGGIAANKFLNNRGLEKRFLNSPEFEEFQKDPNHDKYLASHSDDYQKLYDSYFEKFKTRYHKNK